MNGNLPDVSILLLTYNGEVYLSEVLTSIFGQTTQFHFEVIAIDSGSNDGTLEILKKFQVNVYQIPNHEFGHGKTRNLGVKFASGRYVVFLTQDATPASNSWLDNLVQPLASDSRVAGAYSRQIPRAACNPIEWRDIELGAGPLSMVKRVAFDDELQKRLYEVSQRQFMAFSNVSSCISKAVLEGYPFNEQIAMVEDQEWCKRVIESGYTIYYEATSVVYHSHNFRLRTIYKRHFNYGASYRAFAPFRITLLNVVVYTLFQSLCDSRFIIARRRNLLWTLKWISKSPWVRLAMHYGLYRGLRDSGEFWMQAVKRQ